MSQTFIKEKIDNVSISIGLLNSALKTRLYIPNYLRFLKQKLLICMYPYNPI